jgi:hypothetical protein
LTLKFVLDTNVVLSGLLRGGTPGRLLECLRRGCFRMAASHDIIREYRQVLGYPRFGLDEREIERMLRSFVLPCCELFDVRPGPAISRDAADDEFLYCAVESGAHAIVTGDRDLIALGESFRGIPLLSPRRALAVLSRTDPDDAD